MDCTSHLSDSFLLAGLVAALELLKDIADKYDGVSYADLFQMASAVAIEVSLL